MKNLPKKSNNIMESWGFEGYPPNAFFFEDIAGLVRGFLKDKDGYLTPAISWGEMWNWGQLARGISRFQPQTLHVIVVTIFPASSETWTSTNER